MEVTLLALAWLKIGIGCSVPLFLFSWLRLVLVLAEDALKECANKNGALCACRECSMCSLLYYT